MRGGEVRGVPLTDLVCPTCGVQFNLNLHRDDDTIGCWWVMNLHEVIHQPVWFMLCERGHKWAIKFIMRSLNKPDEILLDQYLGEA